MSRCKWIYAFYRYLSIFIIILRLLQIYWTRWDYWSKFYLPSLQYAACEAQQFDLVAVLWLCWEIFSKNEQWTHKLWNQGGVWKVTRSNKTQKFSLSLEFRFDYNYFKPSYQFGYLISRFFLRFCEGTQQKGKSPTQRISETFSLSEPSDMKWQTNQSAYREQLPNSVYFAPQQENSGC